ncbi:aminotransferase [Actinoplanes sp. SE50]|uniref:aminotransferase class IV n=1 Tax=unclassified Actinoplanes TaxID=2626549 RepID=UPI00023EDF2F|nr:MULTISPECIES: aminotransferase class IV [unclassified Actinoplanes]AEV88832.1 4-amino-4-deoxychorismate lyase [Actinoplanes sp. SE50/110]ATO87238.1 aminotransferase [Actinoplanes sp. SE50]SLM04656.1 aminotransferase [Actinoplanes sp. SE50/110]
MSEQILVSPADLMGDGVFETMHLRPSGPWLLAEHLDRLGRSAALLDLPVPPSPDLSSSAGRTGALRIIYTRSLLHVSVSDIPATVLRERRDGVRVLSAGLGVSVTNRPPWALSAAKSLSYATNFAARRWAARHQADDVIGVSTEGYVMEAPTSSVVWLAGDELCTVPAAEAGILPGITAAHLLSVAGEVGLRGVERMVTLPELAAADAIWLASSLRGLAEVVTFDGVVRERSRWTPRLLELLGF